MKARAYPNGTRYACSGEAAAHREGEGSLVDCKACGEPVRDVLATYNDDNQPICKACGEEEV